MNAHNFQQKNTTAVCSLGQCLCMHATFNTKLQKKNLSVYQMMLYILDILQKFCILHFLQLFFTNVHRIYDQIKKKQGYCPFITIIRISHQRLRCLRIIDIAYISFLNLCIDTYRVPMKHAISYQKENPTSIALSAFQYPLLRYTY